jgi:predicted kinase
MAVVTLGEAARLPGLGKTTLARAIELARVYPFPAPTVATDTRDSRLTGLPSGARVAYADLPVCEQAGTFSR